MRRLKREKACSLAEPAPADDLKNHKGDAGDHRDREDQGVQREPALRGNHVQHVEEEREVRSEDDEQAVGIADELFKRTAAEQEGQENHA